MSLIFPDKWVRKAISEALDGLIVNTKTIPVFDTNTLEYDGDHYIIMSTQTNTELKDKCSNKWRSSILLEVFTRHRRNTGSRVLADDIINEALTLLNNLQLDTSSNLEILNARIDAPNDITDKRPGNVIHRKFLRYEFTIN